MKRMYAMTPAERKQQATATRAAREDEAWLIALWQVLDRERQQVLLSTLLLLMRVLDDTAMQAVEQAHPAACRRAVWYLRRTAVRKPATVMDAGE